MTLRLNGDSSGFTEIKAPNAAGDNSITLPTSNGGANQLLQNGGTAGSLQYTSAVGGLHYDSAGRLLVGTSSYSQSTTAAFKGGYGNVGNPGRVALLRGYSFIQGNNLNAEVGRIIFADDNGDGDGAQIRANIDGTSWSTTSKPTRLDFFTTGSGEVSPTARVAIGSDGALKLLAGCPGIDFSATQPAGDAGTTMSTETLDSYEEGDWTPAVKDAGNQGTWSVTPQRCRYLKVGRMVSISGVLTGIGYSTSAPSPSSYLQITGMPFTKVNGSFSCGPARVNHLTFGDTSYLNIEPITGSATNIMYLRRSINGSGGADFQATSIANGSAAIVFQLTYEADDA